MRNVGIIIWNMRGATLEGDENKKAELLGELCRYWKTLSDYEPNRFPKPIFMLQECGHLEKILTKKGWKNEYQMEFVSPIAAGNNRCTTGILSNLYYVR